MQEEEMQITDIEMTTLIAAIIKKSGGKVSLTNEDMTFTENEDSIFMWQEGATLMLGIGKQADLEVTELDE